MQWDDGTRWLARIKIPWPSQVPLPLIGLNEFVRNEYANMKIARRLLGDLIPNVWLPRTPIGESYHLAVLLIKVGSLVMMFVERVEGMAEPILRGGWVGPTVYDEGKMMRVPPPSAAAVLAAWPEIVEKLTAIPFGGIGTFWPDEDPDANPVLGPFFMGGSGWSRRIGPAHGPYATFSEFINARLQAQLADLEAGTVQVVHHNPVLYYLALLELRELVNGDVEMTSPQPTYLFHDDYWQFMFDMERKSVVAIIDWE